MRADSLLFATLVMRAISFGKQPPLVSQSTMHIRAGFFRGLPRGQRVFRLILVAIESMFRVVKDDFAVVFEKSDRVRDHREVFIGRGAQHFGDVQQPGFADDGDDGSSSFEQ